jgi:hypothetical protein
MSDKPRQSIHIFISSPGDLGPEREALKEMFEALNHDPHYHEHDEFLPFIYEARIKPEDLHGLGWQEYINLSCFQR